MTDHGQFLRFQNAYSPISQRAHHEARRGHIFSSDLVDREVIYTTTEDVIVAIVLEPEVLAHLIDDADVDLSVRAVRQRRSPLRYAGAADSPWPQGRMVTGQPTPVVGRAVEATMRWAESAAAEREVEKWTPHSDKKMFMSKLLPHDPEEMYPSETSGDRRFRFGVMREIFERLLEFDPEEVNATLADLRLPELELQRCFDVLAMRYVDEI